VCLFVKDGEMTILTTSMDFRVLAGIEFRFLVESPCLKNAETTAASSIKGHCIMQRSTCFSTAVGWVPRYISNTKFNVFQELFKDSFKNSRGALCNSFTLGVFAVGHRYRPLAAAKTPFRWYLSFDRMVF